ncbi:hypothetical protein SLEP1_g3908 [Rubroshorea leprosula]|uniref:Protein MIZU-KUSSEI 1 n=1 Tax=Rubroshorea leprosula TaxID=152421 RepID=A0AAV5HUK2_9ROSI|nr:hypothetical protein SLEP1_g3908 [Rubroshorea leprosula]
MKHHQELTTTTATLPRSTSYKSSRKIIPSNVYTRSTSIPITTAEEISDKLLLRRDSPVTTTSSSQLQRLHRVSVSSRFSCLLKSLLRFVTFPNIIPAASCTWLAIPTHMSITPSLGRKVTGTLFGNRRGHVNFAVQDDPRSEPVLLLELAMSTAALVKEMSSGLVRIALECEKGRNVRLFQEPRWSMYCNGRKSGYAVTRACTEWDWHVLSTVQTVSVGAGVIPVVEDRRKSGGSEGELLYMRARFERVVGSRDSEAFYMMNPDKNGGPELSIFLLRL